ncbi:MerR family transcriptional regulator [Ornithinibacillus bavariensis]|uniref:MerR family transcriptional regulator n=1 Tax=Ornithinibacillus bavariensis TaxID=545502 RepID=UPI003D1A6375
MYLVGQLSKATNISIRTLHYYDEIGLLKPSTKSDAGYRYYTKDDLIILQQIIALKKLGFRLTHIKEIIQENSVNSKIERWKQVFEMELDKIEEEKRRLEHMERSLHAIISSLHLTGDLSADDILLIIQSIQNGNGEKFLERQFTKDEQSIIKEQLPDLTSEDEKTKKWIELLKDVHEMVDEPIESYQSQELARRIMQYISDYLEMEDSLIDKYWEKIKPDQEQSEKVVGLNQKTMNYIETILYWYENFGAGSRTNDKQD